MPKNNLNLTSLILSSLDELARLEELQELVQLSIDQLESSNKLHVRLEILLSSYLANTSLHFNELKTHLENARQLITVRSPDSNSNGS